MAAIQMPPSHGGRTPSSAASTSSMSLTLPAASAIGLEELILCGGRGGEKDSGDKRPFGSALTLDTRTDL